MTRTVETRVGLLEQGLNTLAKTLVEIRDDIRADRKERADEMHAVRKELGEKRGVFPYKEVAGAVLTTAAVMSAVMTGLNFWYSAKAGPVEQTVMRIEQTLKDQSPAVLRYRVDEFERRMRLVNPMF